MSGKPTSHLILDTSTLVTFPNFLKTVGDEKTQIHIPMEVLEELDKLKSFRDKTGADARKVNRHLDSLRQKGSLAKGVETDSGAKVFVTSIADMSELPDGMKEMNDNRIISVAKIISGYHDDVTMVSEDIGLRVKSDSVGVKSCSGGVYVGGKKQGDSEKYLGYHMLEVSSDVIDTFYAEGEIKAEEFELENDYNPHEFLVLKNGKQSAIVRVWPDKVWRKLRFVKNNKKFDVEGIKPRNKEQLMSLELLMDPGVRLVSLSGKAGTGKTLAATAAALSQLRTKGYDKIILTRSAESTSKDIGFLPGTLEEKMAPWLAPIFDNLSLLLGRQGKMYLKMMMEKGEIEMQSLSHVRGRSFHNSIIIVEESQNLTMHESKALLTRIGKGSKIILVGDLDQIDSKDLCEVTSGLGTVIETFKPFEGSGHVTLLKGERSALADFAADNL